MRLSFLLGSSLVVGLLALGAACSDDPIPVAAPEPDAGPIVGQKPKNPGTVNPEPEPEPEIEPPVVPETYDIESRKIADAGISPLGILGDDVILFSSTTKTLSAQPIAGGEATKIMELPGLTATAPAKPTMSYRFTAAGVAVWTDIADGVGKLKVWTRAAGFKDVSAAAMTNLFISTPNLSRVAFLKDPVRDGADATKVLKASLAVQNLDGTKSASLAGKYAVNLAAPTACGGRFLFVGENLWSQYCAAGTTVDADLSKATRARLVAVPPKGAADADPTPARFDAATLDAADTLRGDAAFSVVGQLAFMIEMSAAAKGGKGKLINFTTGVARPLEDEVTAGYIGTSFLYTTAAGALKRTTAEAVVGPAPAPKTLATDVATVLLSGSKYFGYATKGDPSKDVFIDTTVDAPVPVVLGDDATIGNFGFNGASTHNIFLDGKSMKVIPVGGGTAKETQNPALGFKLTADNGVLYYPTGQDQGTGASKITFYTISYADAINGGKGKTLTGGTLATQIFTKGKQVIYRRAYSAEAGGGIYVADLPGFAADAAPPL